MNRLHRLLVWTLASLVFTAAALLPDPAHAAGPPAFQAGVVLLYCQPGTSQADVGALAAEVSAVQTTPLLLPDCYLVTLPSTEQDPTSTLNAIATLKTDPRVRWVGTNRYLYETQTTAKPNDPLYLNSSQWDMDLIHMPAAWVLQKGAAGANVAVIDSGGDPNHEDLKGQYLSDSLDFTVNPPGPNWGPPGVGPEAQHGVHVSGTIDAITNNGLGIAGIAGWGQQVKILMCRVFGASGGATEATIANALQYCVTKQATDHIVAINMSLGGPGDPTDATDPLYQATLNCVNAGINVICAAGNDNADSHQFTPAGYPFVISVSATDRNATKTYYSNFGKIEIAAPGGAGNGGPDEGFGPDDILSTRDGGYHYEAGTSMACPHVVGVVALLRSVPGVTAQMVFDPSNPGASVLLANADSKITGQSGVPDTNYGYGLLDAYAALVKVSSSVSIVTPYGINPATGQSSDPTGLPPAPVETLEPTLQFQVNNIPLTGVNISIQNPDGTTTPLLTNGTPASGVAYFNVSGVTSGPGAQYTVQFRYPFNITSGSQQVTINITGQPADPTLPTSTDTRTITIAPHVFSSGLSMVSFPIFESAQDSPSGSLRDVRTILSAPDAILYRWISAPVVSPQGQPVVSGEYAVNGSSADIQPQEASLHPPDVETTPLPVNGIPNITPVGLGYFMKLSSGAQYRAYGLTFPQQLVQIPVREGWNMIGDPYEFEVAFSSLELQTQDGSRYPMQTAVNNGLALPYIYRYVNGNYQTFTLPNGALMPWEGSWIYIVPKNPASLNPNYLYTLIVPASGSTGGSLGRAAAARPAKPSLQPGPLVQGPGSWSLRLGVRSGSLADAYNYVGMSSGLTPAQSRAPKPPLLAPYVSLAVRDSAGGAYQQDIRPISGSQTWAIDVSSTGAAGPASITWPNMSAVPRNYQLTLTDTATGQTVNMRDRSSFDMQLGQGATRRFVIQASPNTGGGRAVVTDLVVDAAQPGRGVGGGIYKINYSISRAANVDVTILGPNGRVVGAPQTGRAVPAGANTVTWTGADLLGRVLPTGAYRVQVRAVTSSGDVTRQVAPLTIIR